MTGLTPEEKNQALVYAKNGADFMFVPSTNLCNTLATGSQETEGINNILVAILLTKQPIRLDTNTVVKYCKGTLDFKNTWLLDHGDIKVVPPQYKKPEIVKQKEKPSPKEFPKLSKKNNLEENNDE